jgi:uncharacterized membrane protein
MNTIFKFYYQAWLLFGVAAPVALHYLWQNGLPQRREEREDNASSLGVLSVFAVKFIPLLLTTGYLVALSIGLLYPYYAVQTRSEEFRGPLTAETRQPATLNGLARVERNNPGEYAALLWLRENTAGDAVIVEAVGGAYSEYGRISANTGRPTLLGWANHQYQWRGSDTPEPPIRERAVEQIYTYRPKIGRKRPICSTATTSATSSSANWNAAPIPTCKRKSSAFACRLCLRMRASRFMAGSRNNCEL